MSSSTVPNHPGSRRFASSKRVRSRRLISRHTREKIEHGCVKLRWPETMRHVPAPLVAALVTWEDAKFSARYARRKRGRVLLRNEQIVLLPDNQRRAAQQTRLRLNHPSNDF